jgi:hypothetical protein
MFSLIQGNSITNRDTLEAWRSDHPSIPEKAGWDADVSMTLVDSSVPVIPVLFVNDHKVL